MGSRWLRRLWLPRYLGFRVLLSCQREHGRPHAALPGLAVPLDELDLSHVVVHDVFLSAPQGIAGTASSGSILPPQRALAARGIPCGQATLDVARVESALSEYARDGTADVEAVRAVDGHRRLG